MRTMTLLATAASLIAATALLFATSAAAQKRVEKQEAKGFPEHIQAATAAFESESWGQCTAALTEAMGIVTAKRREAILAAFPHPEGFEMKPEEDGGAMVFAAAMTGFMVKADYSADKGRRMSVTAMLGSPMIQMLAMQFQNPAFRDENTELIEYEKHKALLTKNGDDRFQLRILIGGDLIEIEANGLTDEQLLAIMSEETVGNIEAAIAK